MSLKYIIGFFIIFGLFFLGIVYFVSSGGTGEPNIKTYSTTDFAKPRLSIEGETIHALGKIKVADKKTTFFRIQNTGNRALQIYNATTTCNCTFGQIKTGGKESPLFSMHSQDKFVFELKPRERAYVEVTYKPYLMPVYGKVIRGAVFWTNDPGKTQVTLSVEAFVE